MDYLDHLVQINLEDAQAVAETIKDHLQCDGDDDKEYWESVLSRLNNSIHRCLSN